MWGKLFSWGMMMMSYVTEYLIGQCRGASKPYLFDECRPAQLVPVYTRPSLFLLHDQSEWLPLALPFKACGRGHDSDEGGTDKTAHLHAQGRCRASRWLSNRASAVPFTYSVAPATAP
jgi:hypothetical protein